MSVLSPVFQKLFALPGVAAILAVDLDTGEPFQCVGDFSQEKIHRISITNSKMLRLKMSMVADQFDQEVENITISLSDGYHLLYLLPVVGNAARSFLHIVLQKDTVNLAYCRHHINVLLKHLSQSCDDVRLLEIESDYLMNRDEIRTRIRHVEANRPAPPADDAPAFLRTEAALRLLGIETPKTEDVP